MANTPTYSLKGQRLNFDDMRAQARRSGVAAPKKPASKEAVETVEDQKLLGGHTPAPIPAKPAPAPAPAPVVVAVRPNITPALAPAPKPVVKPDEVDGE